MIFLLLIIIIIRRYTQIQQLAMAHGADFVERHTERANIDVAVTHNEQSADHIDAHI